MARKTDCQAVLDVTDPPAPFHSTGAVTDQITVEISHQIIGLFSEGLYSSPNKAIEELVSNSFDADATKVHVVVSPDRAASDASIAVIDNGVGMDDRGLKIHWIVGDSVKARNRTTASGRRTIVSSASASSPRMSSVTA